MIFKFILTVKKVTATKAQHSLCLVFFRNRTKSRKNLTCNLLLRIIDYVLVCLVHDFDPVPLKVPNPFLLENVPCS